MKHERDLTVTLSGSQLAVFDRLTDQELLDRTVKARIAAHDCRMNPYRENADGHRWVEIETDAWAMRGREWVELANEVDRRGLKQPDLPLGYDGDSRRRRAAGSTAPRSSTGSEPTGNPGLHGGSPALDGQS